MSKQKGNGIFFTGYLEESTPGYQLLTQFDSHTETSLSVGRFPFSAHTQRKGLLAFIEKVNAYEVILVHGNPQEGVNPSFFEEIFLRFPKQKHVYQSSNLTPIEFL